MCGIFGISIRGAAGLSAGLIERAVEDLWRFSESRGKEASGLTVCCADRIEIFKDSISATHLLRSREWKSWFRSALRPAMQNGVSSGPLTIIGHSRLVTNGAMEWHHNNQPVIKDGLVGVHNGIIVNDHNLWEQFPELTRQYEVDTEVFLALLRRALNQTGDTISAFRETYRLIRGMASVAIIFSDLSVFALATNNGSLYHCLGRLGEIYIFASEGYFLRRLLAKSYLADRFQGVAPEQVTPGSGFLVELNHLYRCRFLLNDTARPSDDFKVAKTTPRTIVDANAQAKARQACVPGGFGPLVISESIAKKYAIDPRPIQALRRCTQCILPETMPFINFDEQGVCNFCRQYRPRSHQGVEALQAVLEPYRRSDGHPDCLVPLSGGRDSSYCLHYVKKVLKMNPIAFTYDWGMITDLARRNQARMCGQLGVEHILLSADIAQKRRYIRMNIAAWLKRPSLGIIPLFMAGDKQYFYFAHTLRKQTGVDLLFYGANPLEESYFKEGFCGIPPATTHQISPGNQVKMMLFYGREFLLNPSYLNVSLFDTAWGFFSFYTMPHHFLRLYKYIPWDEKVVSETLIGEYDWETATDTATTWRIGDGTAAFYNYIYYLVAGFSENDTFRSNQIREGIYTRDRAAEIAFRDNQPRFESIKWYCDIIGLDMEATLERIQRIRRLYPV